MQTSTSVNPTENSRSVTKFGISQFLSDFNKISSNSKFNLLYAGKKFRICYKSTLEKNKLQSRKCSDCTKLSNQISIIHI